MPTYGYRCPSCSREFDLWQRMTDDAGAACPDCGAAARRVFYPAGIVFKGSGFYATDSRAKASSTSGPSTPSGDGAKPEAAKTDATKSEAPKTEVPKTDRKAAEPQTRSAKGSDSNSSSPTR